MNMFAAIVQGGALFFSSFLLHVVIWRSGKPVHDGILLILLFLLMPAAVLPLLSYLQHPVQAGVLPLSLLLHYALSVAYISSYPAAQAHSPSLDIFLILASSPEKRMTGTAIARYYRDRDIVIERVDDLRIQGLIVREGRNYRLRPAAVYIVWFYRAYRRLLGIEFGEG